MRLFGTKKPKAPSITRADIEAAVIGGMERGRDVEHLLEAVGSGESSSNVRFLALEALARLKVTDPRAVAPLTAAMKDESVFVRLAAVAVFSDYVDDPRAAESLTAALAVEKDPEVRSHLEALLARAVEKAASRSPAPASAVDAEQPAVIKFESTAPEKTQRAIHLAERYMDKPHPGNAMFGMLGVQPTRPVYKVVQGKIARQSQPQVDMKIVSVASCLPGEDVDAGDTTAMATLAFDAIEHYASLPTVQALFLLSYRLRAGTVTGGSAVPPEATCRAYAGVENLLLEIYDELPNGGTITDKVVERKIDDLIKSVQ
jgi:hypothetical protein